MSIKERLVAIRVSIYYIYIFLAITFEEKNYV